MSDPLYDAAARRRFREEFETNFAVSANAGSGVGCDRNSWYKAAKRAPLSSGVSHRLPATLWAPAMSQARVRPSSPAPGNSRPASEWQPLRTTSSARVFQWAISTGVNSSASPRPSRLSAIKP